eukprot:Seg1186.8 transcript_id=Seg1186.8/GoldUCD/mRNA.D3Y31 product="All-trans-retinyl ester 13-cis isomerohydrolase" protein_id=Seg1186.8/GoldUCD/D3Y31
MENENRAEIMLSEDFLQVNKKFQDGNNNILIEDIDMSSSIEAKNYGREVFQNGVEHPAAVAAKVNGVIPAWITGTLLRVGPGEFKWGDGSYNHWFRGHAILLRFFVQNGEVEFSSKFLKSSIYSKAHARDDTHTHLHEKNDLPDPCKNIFKRFASYFYGPHDNCNVNILDIKGNIFATADSTKLWRISEETLDTINSVDVAKILPGTVAILLS